MEHRSYRRKIAFVISAGVLMLGVPAAGAADGGPDYTAVADSEVQAADHNGLPCQAQWINQSSIYNWHWQDFRVLNCTLVKARTIGFGGSCGSIRCPGGWSSTINQHGAWSTWFSTPAMYNVTINGIQFEWGPVGNKQCYTEYFYPAWSQTWPGQCHPFILPT